MNSNDRFGSSSVERYRQEIREKRIEISMLRVDLYDLKDEAVAAGYNPDLLWD